MAENTEFQRVRITSAAPGPRYVNTVEGQVIVDAGSTTGELEFRPGELDDLPAGLSVFEGDAADAAAANAQGADGDVRELAPAEWPADLASKSSNDGLIKRDDLIKIANAEGVELESDANKAVIAGRIVAARAAKAAAGQ